MEGSSSACRISEGQSTTRPPYFDGNNYSYWKLRMRMWLQATDFALWGRCEASYEIPERPDAGYSQLQIQDLSLNAKAMNALYCALSPKEFERIQECTTAHEIWRRLEGTHEETSSEEDLGEKETTCLGFMAIGESDIDSESDSDNEVNLDLQEAFNELFEISKSLRVENKSIKKNLSFLRNENDRLEKQLKDIETSPKDNNLLLENQDLINENNKLIEENNSLKLEISDLKTKMDIIEKEIACLRENSNKLINKVDNFYSPKVEKGSPSRRPTKRSGSKLTWISKKELESYFVVSGITIT
jgi:regulator of replication initiation timing